MVSAAIGIFPALRIGPRVQFLLYFHEGDAGFRVAGHHRALHRRRAAPARQQRGMDVEAAQAGRLDHRLRQDQSISDDDSGIGGGVGPCVLEKVLERRLLFRALQAFRRPHLKPFFEREGVHA